MLATLRSALPKGQTLPANVWHQRHRGVVLLLWAHAAFIPLFGLARGVGGLHLLAESLVVPLAALIAAAPGFSRRFRTAVAALGLLSSSAILVHFSGGVIEMHFHFFVMVAVVALYQDWLPFLAAIGYVLVHHGLFGAVSPESVFNHPAAINQPWRWAGIHALFVAGISAACLVTWRLNESMLARQRTAEDRLREETQVVERLNDVGRAVSAELDLDTLLQHVTDAATELTSAAYGAFFYNVTDDSGESFLLYTISGASRDDFAGLPMPRNTAVFGPTFAGEAPVRIADVPEDPRYGKSPPWHGLPAGHVPVRSYLAVPVRSRNGEVLGGLFFGHPDPDRFSDTDERIAVGISAHAAVAIDNAVLYESQRQSRAAAEQSRHRLELLADASRRLTSSLDVDRVLQDLAGIVAPAIADLCVVFLLDDTGWLTPVAAASSSSLPPDVARRPVEPIRFDHPSPVAVAVRTGETQLFENLTAEMLDATLSDPGQRNAAKVFAPNSVLIAPLLGRERPVGALALSTSATSGRALTGDDVSLVEELSRRAAVAVEHARLYTAQRSAAETLQHSLLPEELPAMPGVAVATRYLPGGPDVDVGGDWYDVIALPNATLALAMGDVVGRGVPAASLMGQLRNGLRAYALEGHSPGEMLALLNRLLLEIGGAHQMATLVFMILDPEMGTVRYANAGHPPALMGWRGGSRFLEDAVGFPLGAVAGAEYPEAVAHLEPGATLVLYTDGLVEDRTTPLEVGLEQLQSAVVGDHEDLDGLATRLLDTCAVATPSDDDVAILAVRWLPLGTEMRMELPARPTVVRPLRAALRRWLTQMGATDQESFEVVVAACEATSNAVKHGAPDATGFDFEALAGPHGEITLVVRSQGRWRDRLESAPGGRGLEIMRQFMDDADITSENGTTEVRMRRTLAGAGAREEQAQGAG